MKTKTIIEIISFVLLGVWLSVFAFVVFLRHAAFRHANKQADEIQGADIETGQGGYVSPGVGVGSGEHTPRHGGHVYSPHQGGYVYSPHHGGHGGYHHGPVQHPHPGYERHYPSPGEHNHMYNNAHGVGGPPQYLVDGSPSPAHHQSCGCLHAFNGYHQQGRDYHMMMPTMTTMMSHDNSPKGTRY